MTCKILKVFHYFLPWNLFSIISPSPPHDHTPGWSLLPLPSNEEISQTYFASVVSRMFFLISWFSLSLAKLCLLCTSLSISSFIYLPSSEFLQYFVSHNLAEKKKKNNLTNVTFFQWVSSIFWTMICALRGRGQCLKHWPPSPLRIRSNAY